MKTAFISALAAAALAHGAMASLARAQGINAPLAQPSPAITTAPPSNPVVNTPRGPEIGVGGTRSYEQLSGPGGGIMTPNSNGTSTITTPNGATQTVPTPR